MVDSMQILATVVAFEIKLLRVQYQMVLGAAHVKHDDDLVLNQKGGYANLFRLALSQMITGLLHKSVFACDLKLVTPVRLDESTWSLLLTQIKHGVITRN